MAKNYYTYKITFKDLPRYFYFGFHKHSSKLYFGSPKTWKHLWDQFEPEIQILQWFDTEEEARRVEKSIILETWKNKFSLNENCGGTISSECVKKVHQEKNEEGKSIHAVKMGVAGAATNRKRKTGFFDTNVQIELSKRGSTKCKELKVGCFFDKELKQEIDQKLKEDRRGIHNAETSKKGRDTQRKLGVGFFNSEVRSRGREKQKELQVGIYDPKKREEYQRKATAAVSKSVTCKNKETGEKILFPSLSAAERGTGIGRHKISKLVLSGEEYKSLVFMK